MRTVDIVMYILLFVGVGYVWSVEHKDSQCPSLNSNKDECEQGGGMSFSHTQPQPGDSCATLLQKIYKGAGAEYEAVKWRKALLLSTLSMVLVWIMVGKGQDILPDWKTMYMSIAIVFGVILGSYMYYSYHVYGKSTAWIRRSTQILSEKVQCPFSPVI